jgi:protein-tyrosine-phosphatase
MFVNGYDARDAFDPARPALKYVLFICTHNAGRSQIAQAFFERQAPEDVRAESAGSQPAQALWPAVVEAMREVGIDISDRRPRKLLLEDQLHADWAVTMGCGDVCPYVPSMVESWEIPDPAGRPIEEVRVIRDQVKEHVNRLIAERLHEIQADRSAHQWRLRKMLPSLVEEFEAVRSPEEIRACADAILDRYDDVPVRSHILALANRAARDCLAREHCDALAVR